MSRTISGLEAITINYVNSDIPPVVDNQFDLGSSQSRWQDLYLSGTTSGLKLPTTGGTASELDYHETTSINYTFPSSGNPIVQTAYTYYATRIGNLVTLHFQYLTATGNNTSNNLVIQDLPSRFWPSAQENMGSMTVVDVFVNDTHTQGVCWIEGLSGSITFGIGMTCDAWPASTGIHGIGEFAVSYIKY